VQQEEQTTVGIHVAWENAEHTIIRYEYDRDWTWDDFRAAAETGIALSKSVPHPVAHLANLQHTQLSAQSNGFVTVRNFLRRVKPDRGVVIIIHNQLSAIMLNIFVRIYPEFTNHFYGVASLEEAHRLITHLHTKAD
jgi:hypothetical protein